MAYDSVGVLTRVVDKQTVIKDTLQRARDIIAEHGWGRGDLHRTDNSWRQYDYCMIGAIQEAHSFLKLGVTCSMVQEALLPFVPISRYITRDNIIGTAKTNIIYFNDFAAKDKEQVLAIFDEAIASL